MHGLGNKKFILYELGTAQNWESKVLIETKCRNTRFPNSLRLPYFVLIFFIIFLILLTSRDAVCYWFDSYYRFTELFF